MRKQKDKKNGGLLYTWRGKVIGRLHLHIHRLMGFRIIKKIKAWLGRWPSWKVSIAQALVPNFGFRTPVKLGVVACASDQNLVWVSWWGMCGDKWVFKTH